MKSIFLFLLSSFISLSICFAQEGKPETFKDPRDGQEYKLVHLRYENIHGVLVDKVWFEENLNYNSPQSYCYKDYEAYCDKFGRLYTWHDATSGACPEGWHLATGHEWYELVKHHGGLKHGGKQMQDDEIQILMSGFGEKGGVYYDVGLSANFWDAESHTNEDAGVVIFMKGVEEVNHHKTHSYHRNSVRCVKD